MLARRGRTCLRHFAHLSGICQHLALSPPSFSLPRLRYLSLYLSADVSCKHHSRCRLYHYCARSSSSPFLPCLMFRFPPFLTGLTPGTKDTGCVRLRESGFPLVCVYSSDVAMNLQCGIFVVIAIFQQRLQILGDSKVYVETN